MSPWPSWKSPQAVAGIPGGDDSARNRRRRLEAETLREAVDPQGMEDVGLVGAAVRGTRAAVALQPGPGTKFGDRPKPNKRNPGDFGLTPPAAPRPDKTLCDEAGITSRNLAKELFDRGVDRGLVSDATAHGGFPKQIWAVDDEGRVFEASYGGSRDGCYHGYPIRRSDPLFDKVLEAWNQRACENSSL